MNFKCYNSIFSIKKYWNIINYSRDNLCVYQTYEFNKMLYISRRTSINNIISNNTKTIFIVGFDGDIPCCIAPLIINMNKQEVYLLGYGTNAGYLDFIYNKHIESFRIMELLKKCLKILPGYKFKFTDLNETSELFLILKNINVKINNMECYAIKLEDSYNVYYRGLSKSTRQNIRTIYNRLDTDNMNYCLTIYSKEKAMSLSTLRKLNKIYRKRHSEWYKRESIKTRNILNELKQMKRDIIFQSIGKIPNTIVAVMYINNEPASFFIGYKYDNLIIIPRLAIDTQYSRYTPGGLLLIEYIKEIYKYNLEFIIDLCRGNEHYKSVYGGKVSLTHSIEFNGNELMNI